MEIPKNTTQVGEIQGNQKIFIEDYVISYIKQLCRQEPDNRKRIAFYGVMRTEHEQDFFFIYGASRIAIHGKNDYYLIGQDYEEIASTGAKYFEEYNPLGFVTIEDELPDGIFLVCDGKEKYIKGYHIFYEKNDSMLTFLINMQSEKENKCNDNSTYDRRCVEETTSKKCVEEPIQDMSVRIEPISARAREEMFKKGKTDSQAVEIKLFGIVKSVAASLLIVLCVTAISTLNGFGKIESVQNYFQKAFREIKEKKIPDKDEVVPTSAKMEVQNQLEEITVMSNSESDTTTSVSDNMTGMVKENEVVNNVSETINEPIIELAIEPTVELAEEIPEEVPEETVVSEPKSHVIESGETLISISKTFYGDDSKVRAICELNGITNSDNIQVGQKIILP